jgi:hypothetical protein
MFGSAVLLCLLQNEPVMGHDSGSMMARNTAPVVNAIPGVEPHPYVQMVRVKRFEERFNKLVKAVEEFSQAYNGNKGQVWPAAKAEALRKAMEQLQDADPSFSAKK